MTENTQISTGDTAITGTELTTPRGPEASPAGPSGGVPVDIGRHQMAVAETWVARGYPVVPCKPRGDRAKSALVGGFGADRQDADVAATFGDRDTVTSWWSGRYRRAHVGLLTGRGDTGGLLVVDLDLRKPGVQIEGRFADAQGGTDVLEDLARDAGAPWPDTYTVLTPSGGMHLYFLMPSGVPIGCATGDGDAGPHLGPLIDVRGRGGYVIAAGSYSSAQGQPYTRVSPAGFGPQPVPAWLVFLLRRPAPARPAPSPVRRITSGPGAARADRYAETAFDGEVEAVGAAAAGERNRRLYAAARRLGELAASAPAVLDESTVREQLLAAALAAGLRGGEREALRTIASGWAKGTAGRGAGAA